jgi:hypothetical protein
MVKQLESKNEEAFERRISSQFMGHNVGEN